MTDTNQVHMSAGDRDGVGEENLVSDESRVEGEALHIETCVVSQGKTREDALTNLDEAVEGYYSDGQELTDGERQATGIDPERNVLDGPHPDVLE